MATEEKQGSSEPIFSTSLMLFIVPAYLYLCSYSYEKGICSVYGIPSEFIRPDLTTNLYYSISLFLATLIIYFYPQYLAYIFFNKKLINKPELNPFLRANLVLLITSLVLIYTATFQVDWRESLIVILIMAVIANLFAFVQYSYIKRELKNREYNDIAVKWNKDLDVPMPIFDYPDIFNLRSAFWGITSRQKNFLIILIGIVFFSNLLGKRDAYSKTTYEISVDNKNYILLRKYGDDLILKDYDPETKRLGNIIILLKIGQSGVKAFTTVNTGQLMYLK